MMPLGKKLGGKPLGPSQWAPSLGRAFGKLIWGHQVRRGKGIWGRLWRGNDLGRSFGEGFVSQLMGLSFGGGGGHLEVDLGSSDGLSEGHLRGYHLGNSFGDGFGVQPMR